MAVRCVGVTRGAEMRSALALSKEDGEWLKGIAVLLMLWHHLFAFPERIVPPAAFTPLLAGADIEGALARFAKICVPVFFLVSGYGVAYIQRRDLRHHLQRAVTFLKIYWFYFAALIPIGLIWFPELRTFDSGLQRFNPAPPILLANLAGVSSTYIGEWWFVEPYLLLTLLSPWLTRALAFPRLLAAVSLALLLISVPLLHYRIDTPVISLTGLACWQWPFVTGMLWWHCCQRSSNVGAPHRGLYLLAALGIGALWTYADRLGLILATPLFVLLAAAARPSSGAIDTGMRHIGRHSFPIWLVHTALCYFYLQALVFAPRHSILVFLNLLLLSLLLGMALEAVRIRLFGQLQQVLDMTKRRIARSESGV